MISFKKIAALLCALSVMTAAAGCGSGEYKEFFKAPTETAEVTVSTEEETEEVTEEATEEETTEEVIEEEDEDSENTSSDVDFDLEGTIGTMNYKYSSDWTEAVSDENVTYTLSDLSGAIIIQKSSNSEFVYLGEDYMIELFALQCEKVWGSLDGMEIVSREWVENVVNGKKCCAVTYTYNVSGILMKNTSYFFTNFTDSANDIFAVTSSALTEDSNIDAVTKDFLSKLSFSK